MIIVALDKIYLRGFVPEGDIGHVRLGQPAHVYLDSHPDRALEATVVRVDPKATFTPESTYFKNDRVKQVVGVRLLLRQPQDLAKIGMPADAEVLIAGDRW